MEHFSSDWLKIERKRLRYTQQTLADAVGVSDMTIKRWEGGAPIPSDKMTIMDSLGFDVLFILTGRTSKSNTSVTTADESEFDLIPVQDVEVSAGDGRVSYGETVRYHMAYRKYWLKSRGLNPKDLHVVIARGDSMQPTIDDGESLLVNTADNVPKDGHIYVIRSGDTLWVKRIQKLLDNSLLLISDNKKYEPMKLELDANQDLQVVGKVVNSSKNFY